MISAGLDRPCDSLICRSARTEIARLQRVLGGIAEADGRTRDGGGSDAGGPGTYRFDVRRKELFRIAAARRASRYVGLSRVASLPFGSLLLRLPTWRDLYDPGTSVHAEAFPLHPDVVRFGPLFEQDGSQVKIIDAGREQVLGLSPVSGSDGLLAREVSAYQRHARDAWVPDLLHVECPHLYVRAAIPGRVASTRRAGWEREVAEMLRHLGSTYGDTGVTSVDPRCYIAPILNRLKSFDWSDSAILPNLESLRKRILNGFAATGIRLTVVHGDFALKNIVVGSRGQSVLIDWERSGERSLFYDVANLIFKLPHATAHWLEAGAGALSTWAHSAVDAAGFEEPLLGQFWSYYALFLLERLGLEHEIHAGVNPRRLERFTEAWIRRSGEALEAGSNVLATPPHAL